MEERRLALEQQAAMFDTSPSKSLKVYKFKGPIVSDEQVDDVIGRYGFRRIIQNGALLKKNLSVLELDALFDDIDHDKNGGISFYEFWKW